MILPANDCKPPLSSGVSQPCLITPEGNKTKSLPLGQCTESGVVGNLSTLPAEPFFWVSTNVVSLTELWPLQMTCWIFARPTAKQQTHQSITILGFLEKIWIL